MIPDSRNYYKDVEINNTVKEVMHIINTLSDDDKDFITNILTNNISERII